MPALLGQSEDAKVPGVKGLSSGGSGTIGVEGVGGTGVQGQGGTGMHGLGVAVGVLGTIFTPGVPVAVGVKGDGGAGAVRPGPGGISVPITIGIGVQGISSDSVFGCGVEGINEGGVGIRGRGRIAGVFDGNVEVSGNVEVTGDIRLKNADCAEDFDIAEAESIEPGTVMVLGEEGTLDQSRRAYDKRVAGVVSGAGDYKPGIVLDKRHSQPNRKPIALLGKVYCKVDASYAPVKVGDLLTTSPTPGHAMKAGDPLKAFGAVIGKSLRPLAEGRGLIPILVALQ